MGDSIAMTVRSRTKGAPRVRFARSESVAHGTITVTMAGSQIVVTYGASAVVDAGGTMAPSGGALAMSALTLTAGDFELSVSGEARRAEPSADEFATMWRRASEAEAFEGATAVSAALVVHEAEWEPPVDLHRTRFQPLLHDAVEAPAEPVERTSPSARSASTMSRERRRMMVRRVALLSMLLCAFALAMHARRLRMRRSAAAERPAAAALVAKAPVPASDRAPAVEPASVAVPRDVPPEAIARPRPTAATTGSESKARAAADALSNGAYPEALALYEELAAENQANPAYPRVIELLRARADGKTLRSR